MSTKSPNSTTRPPRLGTCPECGTTLASLDVSLGNAGDRPALYTECPFCQEVVNPR